MTPLAATPEAQRDASLGADDALRMVNSQNAALFLDVDGTLLDLAERPDAVQVPEGLVGTLARAARKLQGALALVSGRTIDEIDRLFSPLRLRASGVHGAQIRVEPGEPTRIAPAASELPSSLRTALSSCAPPIFRDPHRKQGLQHRCPLSLEPQDCFEFARGPRAIDRRRALAGPRDRGRSLCVRIEAADLRQG